MKLSLSFFKLFYELSATFQERFNSFTNLQKTFKKIDHKLSWLLTLKIIVFEYSSQLLIDDLRYPLAVINLCTKFFWLWKVFVNFESFGWFWVVADSLCWFSLVWSVLSYFCLAACFITNNRNLHLAYENEAIKTPERRIGVVITSF